MYVLTILDEDIFSSAIFYPRKINIPTKLPSNVDILYFDVTKNVQVAGILFTYNPELPTILFFHGNGEIAADYFDYYHYYITSGANLLVIDYRGYGFSNSYPRFTDLFSDPPIIYEKTRNWLSENDYRTDLFVMGRSLGSVCAAELGKINPKGCLGIIFESGFASTYHLMKKLFLLGMSKIKEEEIYPYSNEIRMKEISLPALVIHGTDDQLIPISEADHIYELLMCVDKRLVQIKGAGHNDIMNFVTEYFDPLIQFIKDYS